MIDWSKIKELDSDKVCKKLGYNNLAKCKEKLELLQAKGLEEFLKSYRYDFVNTSEEFVKKLSKILGIEDEVRKELAAIQDKERKITEQFPAFIYIDTDFSRKNEPIFVLAFLEGQRRIFLDKEWLAFTPLNEQIEAVREIVKKHYKEHDGKLPVWGEIKRYVYFYDRGKKPIVFDPEGNIISEPIKYSEAWLEVK